MLFKYSTTSATQNEFDSLPRITLKLRRDNQQIESIGLVDSGATVNVLPYQIVTVQGVIKKMSYMELDGITMNKQL
jgi:hypothetical protein